MDGIRGKKRGRGEKWKEHRKKIISDVFHRKFGPAPMHARHFAKISVDNAFGGGDLREISSFRLPYYYSSEDCRRIFFHPVAKLV